MDRIDQLSTARIDTTKEIPFKYRKSLLYGLAGDTVATALYANGIRIFSRSLKYHRPRGLYSLDGECTNTFMQVDGVPNESTDTTLLREGMSVIPQNVLGSPEFDLLAGLDLFGWAMPAGFYYHMMHKPYTLWPFFKAFLRKMAGLGKIDPSFSMPGTYDEIYPQTDVCVVGGGPAGMNAALAAASTGLRVILLEARPWLGGFFDYREARYDAATTLSRHGRELAEKVQNSSVRVLTRTSMVGYYNDNLITAFQAGGENDAFDRRYLEIRAKSVVICSGCKERPLIFENNDRPGVMQTGCAHRLARTYAIRPGKSAVFSVGDDLGIEAAADLADLGVEVKAVCDFRSDGYNPELVEKLEQRNIEFFPGWVAACAHGVQAVKGVTVSNIQGSSKRGIDCDLVAASAGVTQVTTPLFLLGAPSVFDKKTGLFQPSELPAGVFTGGRLLGYTDPGSIEASGTVGGLKAAEYCGSPSTETLTEAEAKLQSLPGPVAVPSFVRAPGSGKKSFVCLDEDTTVKHIRQGCDAGFDRVELSKRYTAAGTGAGQSGIAGHNLPLVMSEYLGENSPIQIPSTVRSPLVANPIAAYAGANHNMYKRTPVHEAQEAVGAIFRRIGVWKRARYFSRDFTSREEIQNVRTNVGIIEVATLGKFRLFGPDALKVLQRVYVGDMSRIPAGKVKYSAMCNDGGCLLDDGVVAKIGEGDYYFTASSGRAGLTVEWLRYHARHEGWNFNIINLTDAFGAINLAGPNARAVLEKLTNADLSNEAFPYMGYRDFELSGGVPVRAFRLGFVGELSYELHMPSSYMLSVWNMLLEAGKPLGIMPFGLEAQNCLRLEKGHVIIGQESEIRTTLHDLGMGWLWYRKKPEAKTVGAAALAMTEHQEGRLKLVGLRMQAPGRCPKDGAAIVEADAARGFVCTARYSFPLKESIGLALVQAPLAEPGTIVKLYEPDAGDERIKASVVKTPFYDPEGLRLRM
ncbi:MAG: 2Fe-2S iron-sulfur cluster-binding protein [Desulfatiglandaceae bacterium]